MKTFRQQYVAGYQGKDAMREKAQRLMKKEMSAGVREYPSSARARDREQLRPYKKGGHVRDHIPTDMHFGKPIKGKRKPNETLSEASAYRSPHKMKKHHYARGGAVGQYNHGGRCYEDEGREISEHMRSRPKKRRMPVFRRNRYDEGGIVEEEMGQTAGGSPWSQQTRRSPEEVQEGPVPDWLQAQRNAEPKAMGAERGLGYVAQPGLDRRMGLPGRLRLGAEQVGRMASNAAGDISRYAREYAPQVAKYARQYAPQLRNAARQYAPQAEQALGRLHPMAGKAFGMVRRTLGFKKGGQADMKKYGNGGNVYTREMMGEHPSSRMKSVNYESQMKGEKGSGRRNFAIGGVGKIRHKQMKPAGRRGR